MNIYKIKKQLCKALYFSYIINHIIFLTLLNFSEFVLSQSQSKFHHFKELIFFISLSENLVLVFFAGIPTFIVYGSISFITNEFAPIIAPSPIVTPDIIETLSPIHTSLPISTKNPFLVNGTSSKSCLLTKVNPAALEDFEKKAG